MNSKILKVEFYYFSGTGNTLLIVKEMCNVFEENRIPARMSRIETTNPKEVNLHAAVGLAFPVAAFTTYPFVWRFVESMPDTNGTPVFMAATMGGMAGALAGPLKRLLLKKGYHPIGKRHIVMPENFYPKRIDAEKNKQKIIKGLGKARGFALDLIKGKASWRSIPAASGPLGILMRSRFVWGKISSMGLNFSADKDLCTKCGLCAQLCPVKNIRLAPLPVFEGRCEQCMRCVSHCPAQAVLYKGKRLSAYHALSAKELLRVHH